MSVGGAGPSLRTSIGRRRRAAVRHTWRSRLWRRQKGPRPWRRYGVAISAAARATGSPYVASTSRSWGSIAPRVSTTSNRPSRAWAMYMCMRAWCWPGTIAAGPPGPSAIRAWSSAAITPSCASDPASVTAAAQSRSPRYRPEHPLPPVNSVAGIQRVVLREQLPAERVGDGLVVVEAAVQALDVRGRDEAEQVLVEVGAHELPAAAREARVVELLEERRDPGRNDRVEDHVGAARGDPVDGCTVVRVLEREVLLAHNRLRRSP